MIKRSNSAKQVTGFLILIQQSKLGESSRTQCAGEQALAAASRMEKPKGARRFPVPFVVGVKDGSRHGQVVCSLLLRRREKATDQFQRFLARSDLRFQLRILYRRQHFAERRPGPIARGDQIAPGQQRRRL